MPRSPLTEQYQRVMSLVEQLRALEPDERNFVLDLLVPEPEPVPVKKSQKKSSKSSASKSTKSRRASGMAAAIGSSLQRGRQKVDEGACAYVLESGAVCNTGGNNPIHDEMFGYAAYHPFVRAVPDAEPPSAPASSGTRAVDVGSVHHAASSGD